MIIKFFAVWFVVLWAISICGVRPGNALVYVHLFCLFVLMLYHFVHVGLTISKQWIKRLAQGHNTVNLVSLELVILLSQFNALPFEPLRSLRSFVNMTPWV